MLDRMARNAISSVPIPPIHRPSPAYALRHLQAPPVALLPATPSAHLGGVPPHMSFDARSQMVSHLGGSQHTQQLYHGLSGYDPGVGYALEPVPPFQPSGMMPPFPDLGSIGTGNTLLPYSELLGEQDSWHGVQGTFADAYGFPSGLSDPGCAPSHIPMQDPTIWPRHGHWHGS